MFRFIKRDFLVEIQLNFFELKDFNAFVDCLGGIDRIN